MKICLLKETKESEGRVALTSSNVKELVRLESKVYFQKGAGVLSGFADRDYVRAGATIFKKTKDGIKNADLVLKVKEPTIPELNLMRPGQMIFCFLHLAAEPQLLKKILKRKIVALGYETIQLKDGRLPLLAPMSEIAGQLAALNGAHFLRSDFGGRGVLLGGTQTVRPAEVVILGGGTVGENAAKIALGLGANTHIIDASEWRLSALKKKYKNGHFYLSRPKVIRRLTKNADLVIGAVLRAGAKAPKLVTKAMVKSMKKGSVIVDVAVDQGGCVATSEVTSHDHPIVVKHGVLHYGVANIPAVVPVTGTFALTGATFPYIRLIAQKGLAEACRIKPELRLAINVAYGEIVHPALMV